MLHQYMLKSVQLSIFRVTCTSVYIVHISFLSLMPTELIWLVHVFFYPIHTHTHQRIYNVD